MVIYSNGKGLSEPCRGAASETRPLRARNVFVEMADADVMLHVQRGSEPAFAEVYRRHYRRLLDFFYSMSRDAQLAEDLCHETFLRVWQLRFRYAVTGSFVAYLFTVARNIWFEHRRVARREWRWRAVLPIEAEALDAPAHAPAPPDELVHRLEIEGRVSAALDAMPEEQRMAFVLRTIESLPLEDIAKVMGCPVNTVRSRRLLAITRLREALRGLFVL